MRCGSTRVTRWVSAIYGYGEVGLRRIPAAAIAAWLSVMGAATVMSLPVSYTHLTLPTSDLV